MTRKINPCTYGGGISCERQGGSGEAAHATGYTHPIPTLKELGRPAGDAVQSYQREPSDHRLVALEAFFDDDFSKSVLGVSFDTVFHAMEIVRKSLYDFDLASDEGVLKLLELLPIMDREILVDIAGEIWPGYPADDVDPRFLRLEIKGYLMDYLDGHGIEEAETAPEGLGDQAGSQEGQADGAGGVAETASSVPGTDSSQGPTTEGTSDTQPASRPGAEA